MCRSATCSSRRIPRSTNTSNRCAVLHQVADGAARCGDRGHRVGHLRYR
jgi:hypothetical protein